MQTSRRAPWTSTAALEAVRPEVRSMLTAIPAFGRLSDEERTALAQNMVKVLSYIANPSGVLDDERASAAAAPRPPTTPAVARAQDANEDTRRNLSRSPGFAGEDFQAGAAKQGVQQFGNLVKTVDFPKFVGGLINNVFGAIVESSLEQMRAYGELVASVAKSVDEFMHDNIGVGAGRDFLVSRYPDALDLSVQEADDGGPAIARLVTRGDGGTDTLKEISREYGIEPPITDLDDEAAELRLVTAARLQMARARQQLLASMVMLGINRIVVTDGTIQAKVRFDMRSLDDAKRGYRAATSDVQSQRNVTRASAAGGGFGFFGFGGFAASTRNETSHVATVSTGVDESSESKVEMSARLQGEVRVNFKSDYLPLDKMATPEMIASIQGNAIPAAPPQAPSTQSAAVS